MKFYQFLCQFVKISHRKAALDEPLYKLSAGRSMVEMLGVLAIIGVLSVGAISGYSKAMTKYKLNKQTEQLSQLLSAMIEYKSIFTETPANDQSLVPIYKKLNIIPQEMIRDNSIYIYDAFNNKIYIYKGSNTDIYVGFYLNKTSYDACINMFNLSKGFSSELLAIGMTGSSSENQPQQQWFWGDNSNTCINQNNSNCINQLNLTSIWDICHKCISGSSCQVAYVFAP